MNWTQCIPPTFLCECCETNVSLKAKHQKISGESTCPKNSHIYMYEIQGKVIIDWITWEDTFKHMRK